jgi:hypothetical protein
MRPPLLLRNSAELELAWQSFDDDLKPFALVTYSENIS